MALLRVVVVPTEVAKRVGQIVAGRNPGPLSGYHVLGLAGGHDRTTSTRTAWGIPQPNGSL